MEYKKIKKILFLLLIMSLYAKVGYAKITETNDFSTIESYLNAADLNTLVIFDIDEVVIETTDSILKPQHKHHFAKWEKELLERTSEEELVYLRSIIFQKQSIKLVDNKILDTLNDLRIRKINTIAITWIPTGHRGKIDKFEDWSLERLQKFNIDFRKFNNLKDHTFLEIPAKNGVPMTKNGVTFTAQASKGELLHAVLKYNNLNPKKVIFIDDKLSHLESVESTCKDLGIAFTGIQYTGVIKSNKWNFDAELASLQFRVLENEHTWLSDQEAKTRLTSS